MMNQDISADELRSYLEIENEKKHRKEQLVKSLSDHKRFVGSNGQEGQRLIITSDFIYDCSSLNVDVSALFLSESAIENIGYNKIDKNVSLNLNHALLELCKINGSCFGGYKFNNANFTGAQIDDCAFALCEFNEAGFSDATCKDVHFHEGEFSKASFIDAVFIKCKFEGIHFDHVDFTRCTFQYCIFIGCQFFMCDFRQADLTQARFKQVSQTTCTFHSTKFNKQRFEELSSISEQLESVKTFDSNLHRLPTPGIVYAWQTASGYTPPSRYGASSHERDAFESFYASHERELDKLCKKYTDATKNLGDNRELARELQQELNFYESIIEWQIKYDDEIKDWTNQFQREFHNFDSIIKQVEELHSEMLPKDLIKLIKEKEVKNG